MNSFRCFQDIIYKVRKFLRGSQIGLKNNFKIYFIALSCPLIFGVLMNAFKSGKEFLMHPGPLIPFTIGVLTWIIFWYIHLRIKHPDQGRTIFQNNYDCFVTDLHESNHGHATILTGGYSKEKKSAVKPYKLDGLKSNVFGHFLANSPSHNPLCEAFRAVAPHCLPTLFIPILPIRPMIADQFLPIIDIIIGIIFGFYIILLIDDLGKKIRYQLDSNNPQSDLGKNGIPFSLAFIILLNLILMPSIVLIIHQGWLSAAKHCFSGFTFWIDLII